MKKNIICFILCLCLISAFVFVPHEKVSADALTAAMVASGAYAIGQSFGMTFMNNAWNSVGVQNMMEVEVSAYCGNRSITEVFGTEAIRAVAGKMVVGHVAYNAITNFLQFLNQKYNLGVNRVGLGFMFSDDYGPLSGNAQGFLNGWELQVNAGTTFWLSIWVGPEGQTRATPNNNVYVSSYDFDSVSYEILAGGIQGTALYSNSLGATVSRNHGTIGWSIIYPDASDRPTRVYATSTGDIGSATVLNPGYGWAGEVNGYEGPDTNIDQLMGQIFGDVADTNLDVDGEVIPLDPPQPVPTWEPVDDVIDGINQTGELLEGLGNDIGDISSGLDDLGEQIAQQQETLEGIQEGVSDIPGAIDSQTGVISGALDQAASDVASAIESQTAALDESLSATAEGIQDITDILTAPEIDTPKFDLRELFPFCIPFDIYHLLQKFDGTSVAPHVQIPIVIPSIGFSYTLDLDFSAWDPVAVAMRTAELIVYALGLAWATSKVIKW